MRPRSYMRPLAPASSVRVPPTVPPTVIHDTQKIPHNTEVLITPSPQQTKQNVHMNVNGKCIVCSKFALYLCSKCQLFWYCSPQCQVSKKSPFSKLLLFLYFCLVWCNRYYLFFFIIAKTLDHPSAPVQELFCRDQAVCYGYNNYGELMLTLSYSTYI